MTLILFVASQHTPKANANVSISGNGFTMVTTPGGQGTDLLYVIDDQNAMLLIYDLPNPQNESYIRPVHAWSLPKMFSDVRK